MENITIRNVCLEDAPRLLEIYTPYVLNTAVSLEYEAPSLEEFKNRIETISKKYPYLVVCHKEKPVGYTYASAFHFRKAYENSVELSIYISPDYHHKGLGKLLYQKMESELKSRGFAVMYACITATSRRPDVKLTDGSIRFHEKLGFTNAGYFQNCAKKFGSWYNMVYMQKNLLDEYKDEVTSESEREVIDVYDNQKRVTGKTILRTELFVKSKVLRSIVHICVFNSKYELLIQQRASVKKSGANMWDFSASGQVAAGETFQMGAMRELKEELGINAVINYAPVITKVFFNSYNDYFIVRSDVNIKKLKLQETEVQAVKWASREEVLKLLEENRFLNYPKSLIELVFDVGEHKD